MATYDTLNGMPLSVISSRTINNSPLPCFIHQIMNYILLKSQSFEGIFRKNGVKCKIEKIKEKCSTLDVNEKLVTIFFLNKINICKFFFKLNL